MKPVNICEKIDLSYMKNREYSDGINEQNLDKQRKMLARKHESMMHALQNQNSKKKGMPNYVSNLN